MKLELSSITIAQSGENNSNSVHTTIIHIRLIANHHAETREKIRDQDSEDGISFIEDQSKEGSSSANCWRPERHWNDEIS